ncbi:MAG: methyltransferase domain-containing protein [Acidimicrobiia bacterium]|nr:methyltransferase domain-containing protein [Acidimicrobiia bacterium]
MEPSTSADPYELARMYRHRFDDEDLEAKELLWDTLCRSFFQQYVEPTDTVLDLGAGSCEFVNNIQARRKIAVDLNPDTVEHARGAEVLQASSEDLSAVADGTVDVVFTSNFFEHLPDKKSLLTTLGEVHRVLRPGGRLVVLMPNLRYLAGKYWDYFDHHLPLTHLSLVEALELSGFGVDRVVPRFLPYTVKGSRLPIRPELIRLYLRAPLAWRLLGRQMLVVAHS